VRAAGINNRGHVHGENDRTAPGGVGIQQRSFLWKDGVLEHIYPPVSGTSPPAAVISADINGMRILSASSFSAFTTSPS